MTRLAQEARDKAQNDEMVDQYFTETGKLLNQLADALDEADKLLAEATATIRRLKHERDQT